MTATAMGFRYIARAIYSVPFAHERVRVIKRNVRRISAFSVFVYYYYYYYSTLYYYYFLFYHYCVYIRRYYHHHCCTTTILSFWPSVSTKGEPPPPAGSKVRAVGNDEFGKRGQRTKKKIMRIHIYLMHTYTHTQSRKGCYRRGTRYGFFFGIRANGNTCSIYYECVRVYTFVNVYVCIITRWWCIILSVPLEMTEISSQNKQKTTNRVTYCTLSYNIDMYILLSPPDVWPDRKLRAGFRIAVVAAAAVMWHRAIRNS